MGLECHPARRINCITLRCTVNGLIVPTVNKFLWSTAAMRRCDEQQPQGCKMVDTLQCMKRKFELFLQIINRAKVTLRNGGFRRRIPHLVVQLS